MKIQSLNCLWRYFLWIPTCIKSFFCLVKKTTQSLTDFCENTFFLIHLFFISRRIKLSTKVLDHGLRFCDFFGKASLSHFPSILGLFLLKRGRLVFLRNTCMPLLRNWFIKWIPWLSVRGHINCFIIESDIWTSWSIICTCAVSSLQNAKKPSIDNCFLKGIIEVPRRKLKLN